jgi:hypothetical protein
MQKTKKEKIFCLNCGKEKRIFDYQKERTKFCSPECREEYKLRQLKKSISVKYINCLECGRSTPQPRGIKKFCSSKCRRQWKIKNDPKFKEKERLNNQENILKRKKERKEYFDKWRKEHKAQFYKSIYASMWKRRIKKIQDINSNIIKDNYGEKKEIKENQINQN